jgi:SpoVK/Ycf46/Vps4 family AAA+-type ATPase
MDYSYLAFLFILTLKEFYFNIFIYLIIFLILFAIVYYIYCWYNGIEIIEEGFSDLIIESSDKNNIFDYNKKFNLNKLILPEDSDKDSDVHSISLSDIIYKKELKEKEKVKDEKHKNIKIINLIDIIKKDNIDNISDLLQIANYYEEKYLNVYTKYNKKLYQYNDDYFTINLEKVYKIKKPLIKLKKLIGLQTIKNDIIDLILYYLTNEENNNNMMHMTLEGPPGCGKTKLARIISQLLNKMEILTSDKIVYAKSTDLIAEYVGQTGSKTQKVINSALGGVLFIDEAYALGTTTGREYNFGAECINVLNQNLSDNKNKFICIIAGYADELDEMFFSFNPGLKRRFPFKFTITNYTYQELMKIFIQKVYKLGLKIDSDINLEAFFKDNYKQFKFFGGDIETLLQNIKYTNSRRTICSINNNKVINMEDLNNGLEKLKNSRKENKNKKSNSNKLYDLIKKLVIK